MHGPGLCIAMHSPVLTIYLFSTEKAGKTIHLLKARSKPIQSGRKRKKVSRLGTFEDYKSSKKKAEAAQQQQPAPAPMPPPNQPSPRAAPGSIQQLLAGAASSLSADANMKKK